MSKKVRRMINLLLASVLILIAAIALLFSQDNRRSEDLKAQASGVEEFTPEQDSAFARALRSNLPLSTRMAWDISLSKFKWELRQKLSEGTPWQYAVKNMQSIPREAFIPDPREVVQFRTNIEMSQYVPFVRNTMPYGLHIPLSSIGQLLGITEDVSPSLKYTVDYSADVEVVIYSERAVVVATLFKGVQPPGTYNLTWNFRDDQGREMPSGDYIAEIRIGKQRYYRKYILKP